MAGREGSSFDIRGPRLGIGALTRLLDSHDIDDAYDRLGYDYSMEVRHHASGAHSGERQAFIDLIGWKRPPRRNTVLRLFNQINTYYAETSALARPHVPPMDHLERTNRPILHRGGKTLGIRTGGIGFGVRTELPFGDVRRHFQRLRGIAPAHIERMLGRWAAVVERAPRHPDVAVGLMLALLAIHPFADGNGRSSRVTLTWIRRWWSLPDLWMAEANDGEFLCTGDGLASTEYLMGEFLAELCGDSNRIRPVASTAPDEDDDAATALLESLDSMGRADSGIIRSPSLSRLLLHLEAGGHFRSSSPRFECLRGEVEA